MKKISECVVNWYNENKRDLPWRENRDPYRVWVSEIMLQQTRVEAVKPYFERFMEQFDSVERLALADEDQLYKVWEGLGYYSRVRNMKKAAQICVEHYQGKLPVDYDELLRLPGIGPYTAGAIASIAYQAKVCAIDGNVMRIYARLFALEDNIISEAFKKKTANLIQKDMAKDMGIFNQGLMDLGATICLPNGNPRCNICPLNDLCQAYAQGKQNRLPNRIKKTKRKVEKLTVEIYEFNDQVLLHRRSEKGLLAGLYEFVSVEGHKVKKDYPKQTQYLGKTRHVFSHRIWEMKGFLIPCEQCFEKEGYFWDSIHQIENVYSIPSAFQFYKEKLLKYND